MKFHLLSRPVCLSAIIVLQTSHAYAQAPQAATAENTDVAEIVVTANKREEKLNRVGLTVTALGNEIVRDRKIVSLQDVSAAVPGLSFSPSNTNTPILTLRGVGFNESSLGVYPAVSVYVDQVPLPFPVLGSHAAFDLQRIEVLKGPQGTLFGQNSTGGAINFIAAKPTSSLEAGGDISYGRFNEVVGNAYLSGPLSGTLRARIAVTGANSDGWQISSSRPYDRNGATSYIAGRAIVDWEPADTVRLSFSLNMWRDTSEPVASQYIALRGQNPAVSPATLAYPFSPQTPRAADWSTGLGTPRSNRRFIQPALRADIDITDNLTLTSLTSYADYSQRQTTDGDGLNLAQGDLTQDIGNITSFNQELRLANSPSSSFRWLLGANYEDSRTYEEQYLDYTDSSQNSAVNNFISTAVLQNKQNIKNYAFFVSSEFDIASDITLKGAIRYTDSDNRGRTCDYDGGNGNLAALFNLVGGLLATRPFTPIGIYDCYSLNSENVPGTPFNGRLHQNNVSWRAGVDYRLSGTALIYANVSRGYKAGSFPVLATAVQTSLDAVTQEELTAYEAGAKASFLNRSVQLAMSGFYYDYRDKQIRGKIFDPRFAVLDLLVNVPKSSIYGVEADATVVPVSGLTLSAAATYLKSKVVSYSGYNAIGEANQNFAGARLPYTPRWTISVNADYKYSLGNGGKATAGVSVNTRSSQDAVIGGDRIVIPQTPISGVAPGIIHPFEMDGYTTVDLRAAYLAPDDRWTVSAWAKNVFNKYYAVNVITFNDVTSRFAGRPATYGVTFGFKFR